MNTPTTVVGARTHVKGNLEGEEDLNVVGRVDGNIALTKTLTVDPDGVVVADIQVAKAIISGTVIGNITATDMVHVTQQGRVVGDIAAPRVILVDGASFRGNIDMGNLDAPRAETSERPFRSVFGVKSSTAPVRQAPELRPAAAERRAPPRPAPPPKRVHVEVPRTTPEPATAPRSAAPAARTSAPSTAKQEPASGTRENRVVEAASAPESETSARRRGRPPSAQIVSPLVDTASALEKRAEAAAKAVASAARFGQQDHDDDGGSDGPEDRLFAQRGGPMPPTAAGKKARARKR